MKFRMLILLSLTACATSAPLVWRDPSGAKSHTDFKRDKVNCEVKAKQAVGNNPGCPAWTTCTYQNSEQGRIFADCMEAEGWTTKSPAANDVSD